MKVIMINKQGEVRIFRSVKEAKPNLRKDAEYEEQTRRNGEIVRVYDDRKRNT